MNITLIMGESSKLDKIDSAHVYYPEISTNPLNVLSDRELAEKLAGIIRYPAKELSIVSNSAYVFYVLAQYKRADKINSLIVVHHGEDNTDTVDVTGIKELDVMSPFKNNYMAFLFSLL